ncbi:hypothetical protein [Agaribacter marinus]|uniref:Phosphate ABC transporter substrate-binding protein n=1 Tax=Agaribacter marinus TaxID=1431249 RepID=A0AA37SWM1_9ALTE|nr:hypothetical protein [Agaribacter marinus]GLR69555.1 hypothetical protein GCM10007852_04630 [Agaribacter marinus]
MKSVTLLFLFSIICFNTNADDSTLIIVANTKSAPIDIEKRQVRDIFMGNNSSIPLLPVALSPKSPVRFLFNTKIVGLTESRIQSYWAQMRFSGRNKPPQEFDSVDSLLAYVQNNEGTITYLPSTMDIPDGLTVIYSTE